MCDFIGVKNDRLHYECNKCKKRQLKPINGLIKKFSNTYRFSNRDTNKFVLLLRKGVHPYECMGIWEAFAETSLTDKIYFYSELNLENIIDNNTSYACSKSI